MIAQRARSLSKEINNVSGRVSASQQRVDEGT
jgi:hypothetical protein